MNTQGGDWIGLDDIMDLDNGDFWDTKIGLVDWIWM